MGDAPAGGSALAWALVGSGIGAAIALGVAGKLGVFGRDGLDRGRLEPVRAWPSPVWLVLAALAFLAQGVGLAVAQGVGLGASGGLEGSAQVKLFAAAIGVGVAVLLAMVAERSAPGSGLAPRRRDLPIGVVAFAIVVPVVAFISLGAAEIGALVSGPAEGAAHDTLRLISEERSNPWVWALVAVVVIGAPIVEEIVYRGFLQSALLSATRSPWAAILITAFVFALTHWGALPPDGRHALAPLFALGVMLGVIVERTGSVWPAVIVHALFNGANIAVALAIS